MRCENAGATESSEDYLEAILVIRAERGFCRNADIAERLGVSRPSVTKALANLSSQSLVEVVDRDVRLARRGLEIAQTTFEKHEFFRRLLCDAGVDGGTASEEACRMEHCISDPSFRRLADHLAGLRGQGGGGWPPGRPKAQAKRIEPGGARGQHGRRHAPLSPARRPSCGRRYDTERRRWQRASRHRRRTPRR